MRWKVSIGVVLRTLTCEDVNYNELVQDLNQYQVMLNLWVLLLEYWLCPPLRHKNLTETMK
jgi:hypothetical protein